MRAFESLYERLRAGIQCKDVGLHVDRFLSRIDGLNHAVNGGIEFGEKSLFRAGNCRHSRELTRELEYVDNVIFYLGIVRYVGQMLGTFRNELLCQCLYLVPAARDLLRAQEEEQR